MLHKVIISIISIGPGLKLTGFGIDPLEKKVDVYPIKTASRSDLMKS